METGTPNHKESDRLDQDPETPSYPCRECHILNLPYDILYLVFNFGWKQQHNFPVLVSHVCGLWRQYTLDTPGFWTSLQFRTAVPEIEKYRAWLERSRDSPFDLEIGWQPFERASVKHAKAIMRLVFPHVQRIRSLQVDEAPRKIRRLILDRLDGARLPSLEILEVKREWASDEGLPSAERTFKPFKNGDAIDLKTVLLQNIPYDYTIRRFKNLKHLDIVSSNVFGNSNHDNAKTVQDILSLLPHLQTLRISMEYSPNSRPTDIQPSSHPPPLTHSSLEELSLDATRSDIDTVVCALALPSLHQLIFRGGGALPIGIYCLPTLAQARPSYPLPNLRMLRIVGTRRVPNVQTQNDVYGRNMEFLERALVGLPKLRSLSLEYVDLKDGKYLTCLARTCPRLEQLTIRRCRGLVLRDVRDVIQSRRDPKGLDSDSLDYLGVEDDLLSIRMLQEKAKQDGLGEDPEFNIEISKARRTRIVFFERGRHMHCAGVV